MKIMPECVPCLLTRGLFECRISCEGKKDFSKKEAQALRTALRILEREYGPDKCSAVVATRMHNGIYRSLGVKDPYGDIKKRSNKTVKRLLEKAKKFRDRSKDPLEAAFLVSVIGNLLDFGIPGVLEDPEEIGSVFNRIAEHGLDVNQIGKVRHLLAPGNSIVYLADNAGEILFDRLACETIKGMGVRITFVVKGGPILTDATMEDAVIAGIGDVVDEVLTTGSNAVGLDIHDIGHELRTRLFKSDLVIAKGMANFEALSEPEFDHIPRILYLLRTKCHPVAHNLGVDKDLNVAIYRQNRRRSR
jgi:uncharacterized protein with ATP-grasp and redox domains